MNGQSNWADDGVEMDADESSVRPYLVAGGRTEVNADLEYETLVERTGPGGDSRFEAARLLDLTNSPTSIAELSAHLSIPIGTTMVLAGQLIETGQLRAHAVRSSGRMSDLDMMERIISRVRSL